MAEATLRAVRVLLGRRLQGNSRPLDFPGAPLRGAFWFVPQ